MTKLRLAVVGAGHLGRIHARLASGLDGIELVGVVDPVEANRRQVTEETGAPGFASIHELFGVANAAVVATPTTSHSAVAKQLMQGGCIC